MKIMIRIQITFLLVLALSTPIFASASATDKLELKNNQVYLNNIQLTSSPYTKENPILSADRSKVVFEGNESQLGIVDVKTKKEHLIKLSGVSTQIMDLTWISSKRLGVYQHISPRVDLYETYDVATGKLVDQYYGYSFLWNKAKTKLLYLFDESAVNLNDTVLYQAPKGMILDNSLCPYGDFQTVTFFERKSSDETKSNIVILTLQKGKTKVTKVSWNKELAALKWSNANLLSIGDTVKYDLKKAKLMTK